MENILIEIKATNEKGKSETASFPYNIYFEMKEKQNINMLDDLVNSLAEKVKNKTK
jgi:predicted RNase H-like nuclease (RuvC/YqgF family)